MRRFNAQWKNSALHLWRKYNGTRMVFIARSPSPCSFFRGSVGQYFLFDDYNARFQKYSFSLYLVSYSCFYHLTFYRMFRHWWSVWIEQKNVLLPYTTWTTIFRIITLTTYLLIIKYHGNAKSTSRSEYSEWGSNNHLF